MIYERRVSLASQLFREVGLPTESIAVPAFLNKFDDAVAVSLNSEEFLVFTDWDGLSAAGKTNKLYAWLFSNETPTAYVCLHLGRDPEGCNAELPETAIGSVEVRKEFRGRGLAVKTLRSLERFTGHKIFSSGYYTPEGFRSLHGEFPLKRETLVRAQAIKNDPSFGGEHIGVWFDSMSFVEDWDSLKLSTG